MDEIPQTCTEPVKGSPLTSFDVERKSRMSMGSMLLIQFRAVLLLECQPDVGPPTPSWIQSYNSLHIAGVGFKKIRNSLPAWQVALASIVSPSHFHPVEIDGAQYQDVSSVGYIDLCAAVYAEICEDTGCWGKPVAISIGSENSERSNTKRSRTRDKENPAWIACASDRHRQSVSRLLYEDLHRYYRFEIPKNVHDGSSRGIGRTKALRQRIERKLLTSIRYIPDVLRGSDSREEIETSNDESNRKASSTDTFFEGSTSGSQTLESMNKLTEAYLLRDDVQTSIAECAQTLVEHRRQREQLDPVRWRREYWRVRYQCKFGECEKFEVAYDDPDALSLHLLQRHSYLDLSGDKLASIVRSCGCFVL